MASSSKTETMPDYALLPGLSTTLSSKTRVKQELHSCVHCSLPTHGFNGQCALCTDYGPVRSRQIQAQNKIALDQED